jgi:ketosteroid isomerase-like protein
VGLSE